ncbi:MAG: SCO family protein [Pseudobdellovibrionaceae bacterium]
MPKTVERIGETLPNISMRDHQGRSLELNQFKGLPTILLPFYSACHASCPLTVKNLIETLARLNIDHRKYQVLLFSIDSKETDSSLKKFREVYHLPASWLAVRAGALETQTLMSALNYDYISSKGEYNHPDLIVFLSPSLSISNVMSPSKMRDAEVNTQLTTAANQISASAKRGPLMLTLSIITLLFSSWVAMHLYLRKRFVDS